MHTVHAPDLRARIAQGEFDKIRTAYAGSYVEREVALLPRTIADLIAGSRPVEAEHYLRAMERLTGVITAGEFQRYMRGVVVDRDGGDLSWT